MSRNAVPDVEPARLRMGFVGVSTGSSSIMKVFPQWADALGLPTRLLVGHDIEPGADPQIYRDVVALIKNDATHLGALVTTHKINVFEAAGDLFDDLDELARTFGEISSIAKRGTRLTGAAKDPVTVRLALEDFVAPDHFTTTGAGALVLGSGGSGCALSHQLGVRGDRPSDRDLHRAQRRPARPPARAARAGRHRSRPDALREDGRARRTSTPCWRRCRHRAWW